VEKKYTLGRLANLPDVQYPGEERTLMGLPFIAFKIPGIASEVYVPLGAVRVVLPPEPGVRSVVIDDNGRAWQHWGSVWVTANLAATTWQGLNDTYGPLEVVYDH
jgi:hypothetical protein